MRSVPPTCTLQWVTYALLSFTTLIPAADRDIRPDIDQLFSEAKDAPGASLLVAYKGKLIYEHGYGLANLEWTVPNGPQTRFRIGSITKCFTAVAILQLHEAGALNLSDLASKYLTNYPNAERFTLRHLLSHTAGVAGKKSSLGFVPGDRVDYSNEGYLLLGRIVEKVSGKSYSEYLNERIFGPLGMTNSGLDRAETLIEQRAAGYLVGPDGTVKNAAYIDAGGAFSAGGLYSTVEDLWAFDRALYGETLLKKSTLSQAFTPVKLNDGRQGPYGYGWMVRQFRGLLEVGHGGDITGFNSYLLRFPDQECTVIVLCNVSMHASGKLPSAGDLAHRVAALVLRDVLQPEGGPVAIVLDTSTLDRYVGTYEYDAPPPFLERTGKTLTIVREGNALFATDKMGKAELVPESTTHFSPKGSPAKLIFRMDAKGKPSEALLSISGLKEISARRVQ